MGDAGRVVSQTTAASSLQRDLQSALESEVGSVLTGELGRKLLQVFRDRHDENYTKTGQPRDELKKRGKKLNSWRAFAGLRERQRDYEGRSTGSGSARQAATLRRRRNAGEAEVGAAKRRSGAAAFLSERERCARCAAKDVTLSEERLSCCGKTKATTRWPRDRAAGRRRTAEAGCAQATGGSSGFRRRAAVERCGDAAQEKSDEHSAASAEVSLLRRSVDRQRLSAELFERNSRLWRSRDAGKTKK